MTDTNQLLQASNQVAQVILAKQGFVLSPASWDAIKWISVLITSSASGVLINQWLLRRQNRIRVFRMEKVDFHNIHVGNAMHRGNAYDSVRCATYRIKNSGNLDYRELVLHMGFRSGEIIHVKPSSDIIGEDHFKNEVSQKQLTINIPIFNRGDVLDVKIEVANCEEIDLVWKYVGSHTGIQIELPSLRASAGVTTQLQPMAGGGGRAPQIQRTGPIRRIRMWVADKIRGKSY